MNLIDRAIGWVSPAAGLRRVYARSLLDEARAYEGAATGRRTAGWKAASSGANSEIRASAAKLRDRSRALVRDNEWAASAVRRFVAQTVGSGIVPDWAGSDKLARLWDEWAKLCDIDGRHDFYGLQALAARTMFESGESLVRIHYIKAAQGVPLRLQLLEGDHIDSNKRGDNIIDGIEYSPSGERLAYWLFEQHPGDSSRLIESRRIPAAEVLHLFEVTRPGQQRGVPRFAPVIMTMRDLSDFDDATLVRKKLEACLSAFVTSTDDRPIGIPDESGTPGTPGATKLAPGMVTRLRPGESVDFLSPTSSGDYTSYTRERRRGIAAGLGLTYEQLTGDYSQVNYSSARMGRAEFRREAEQWQWLTFIPQMCAPVVREFMRAAFLAGQISQRQSTQTPDWTTPRWEHIDPVKDANGDILHLLAGGMTWEDYVRSRGINPTTHLEKLKAERERLADLPGGITLNGVTLGPEPEQPNDGAPNAQPT